jgi:hypothetical protein
MNSHHHINAICLPLITTEQYAMNGEMRGHKREKKKSETRIFQYLLIREAPTKFHMYDELWMK